MEQVALAVVPERPAVLLLQPLPARLDKRRDGYYACHIDGCRVAIKWDYQVDVTRCAICSEAIPQRSAVKHMNERHQAYAQHFVQSNDTFRAVHGLQLRP
jgi:hypothetical protein